MNEKVGATGTFLADISQDPDERSGRCGPWFPALARSSIVACLSCQPPIFVSNKVVDYVMGFPSMDFPECQPFAEAIVMKLHQLPKPKHSRLIGNGMHCGAMLAFLLYMLKHCARRSDVDTLCRSLARSDDTEAEDSEDGEI